MGVITQRSFSGGELAPALYGRTDISKYVTGLRTLRNLFTLKSGGASNRPGLKFIAEVKNSAAAVRLVEFIFNDDNTYVMEFGNLYIRFYRNALPIEVSGVTAWNSGTSYVIGDLASRLGVNYYCISAHSNQQPPNATYWYPLTGDIFEIPTTYATADLLALQFAQSADVVIITHPSYAPRRLVRSADTDWVLEALPFGTEMDNPATLTQSGVAAPPSTATSWAVTAVGINGEESYPGAVVSSQDTPSSGSPITLTWAAVTGAVEYRVYREFSSAGLSTGLLGSVSGLIFADNGEVAEAGGPPEVVFNFDNSNDRPAAVTIAQQRLFFGGSNNNPERIWGSRVGSLYNFLQQFPVRDDDPLNFILSSKQVNGIYHLLDLRQLLALTPAAEWAINGNADGFVTPTAINAKPQSYNGAGRYLRPLAVGDNFLYIQARGSVVRDLSFNFQSDGYAGNDLTIFSTHLFEGHTIVDWAYQRNPFSIIWAVRDDGVLLALTYLREHEMLAWSRHDTEGLIERVCVVPEGTEDALYLVVKRTIDGSTKRYVERMSTRLVDDDAPEDLSFLDSFLSYDGRNTNTGHTMTLSGGTTWTAQEAITLTSSTAFFVSGDVGNAIHLTGSDGTLIRFQITGYTSNVVVTGIPQIDVPVVMRSVAISDWAKAVDEISGLDHLEGEEVGVIGDGFVVASPNNDSYLAQTVESGTITLDRPYTVIHVGLPYISDLETLDIDSSEGGTYMDFKKLVTKLTVFVEKSRGFWAGGEEPDGSDPLENLVETKLRQSESYNNPIALRTEAVELNIQGSLNKSGRIFIRNVDPIPLTILAISPGGFVPVGVR